MSLITTWSLTRLLLVCLGWGLVSFLVLLWPYIASIRLFFQSLGDEDVGAVSFSVLPLLVRLAIVIVPPVVLFVIWLAAQASSR